MKTWIYWVVMLSAFSNVAFGFILIIFGLGLVNQHMLSLLFLLMVPLGLVISMNGVDILRKQHKKYSKRQHSKNCWEWDGE